MEPIDPTVFTDAEVRAALAARDVSTVYRLLRRVGVTQRRIAALTGQSQSEVCEILHGRHVQNVGVLERIADGLGIPRGWMSLGYVEQAPDPAPAQEVDEDVKRRTLFAATSGAALDHVVLDQGKPLALAVPTEDQLPARLDITHVQEVRTHTEGLVGMVRSYGGQAGPFTDAVRRYTRWLAVPAPEPVTAALVAALVELHTEAGWACHDSGLDGRGHFVRALGLAQQTGNTYGVTKAAWTAGATLVRDGYPNDALKLFQLGSFAATTATRTTRHAKDPRLPTLTAWLHLNSATSYALMGGRDQATRYLTKAHQGWEPRDAFEHAAMDRASAGIYLDLGELDTAEALAATALHTYHDNHRRDRTMAALLLAEIYIRAGEPQGLTLARQAIDQVRTLHSLPARQQRLIPLATALDTRPGTETRELAHLARHIATTGTQQASRDDP